MKNWLLGKDPDAGKDWKQEEKGLTEDEMVEWHYWLDGHEFEQALGVGDGQGSLACCSPWGCKRLDTAWPLNNNKLHNIVHQLLFNNNHKYKYVINNKSYIYNKVYNKKVNFPFLRSGQTKLWKSSEGLVRVSQAVRSDLYFECRLQPSLPHWEIYSMFTQTWLMAVHLLLIMKICSKNLLG